MLKILVIDDSKAVHAFIKSCFTKIQGELTHTYNGQEGVDMIRKTGPIYDLILLDWEMPILTGPETVDQIRKEWKQIPILMMTTKNNPEDIMQMINKGVSEYMLKPFTTDILVEKMEICLGKALDRVA